MYSMLLTLSTTQSPMYWLNAEASRNIELVSVTLWTAQPPMSWLKAEAPKNISFRVVTLSTAQSPMSWSKAEAYQNILYIVVAPEVSHAPMSSSKDAAAVLQLLHAKYAQNKYDMSVTPPVAHVEMWPYVASADALLESHAATAVRMLVSSKS